MGFITVSQPSRRIHPRDGVCGTRDRETGIHWIDQPGRYEREERQRPEEFFISKLSLIFIEIPLKRHLEEARELSSLSFKSPAAGRRKKRPLDRDCRRTLLTHQKIRK